MRVFRVLIVPRVGHYGKGIDLGKMQGRIVEADVLQTACRSLVDELCNDHVICRLLPVFDPPGMSEDQRIAAIEPNDLVLHLGLGTLSNVGGTLPKDNYSFVAHGEKPAARTRFFAELISDALYEWGQCTVFGHMVRKAVKDPEDKIIQTQKGIALRVEPFCIDGPGALDYAVRARELGRDLGIALSRYVRSS